MEEKILTQELVKELGLDKLEVITADMLDGYTRIGSLAFNSCSSLTSVTIGNSVTSIGSSAFRDCSSLTSVTIPNSVTSIESLAFSNCLSLTFITIPNSVTSIGYSAFYGCSSLISIIIGNSVTSIGVDAFRYCSSLTSVTIPDSVTNIGGYAFCNTGIYNNESNWENNVLYIDNCLIEAKEDISGTYTIKEGTRLIASASFCKCPSLISVTIPNSVTHIGNSAFWCCKSLTSVTILNSVTYIGEWAFHKCNIPYTKQYDEYGRLIAYKGFNSNLTCRDFQYEEGKTYEIDYTPKLCVQGFHACLNPLDIFTYYYGKLNEDVVIHKVYLEGVIDEIDEDSKIVAKKIIIGERLTIIDINNIINQK